MKAIRFNTLLSAAIMAMLTLSATGLKAEKHWVPGMGTYGVSNEKRTCSVCGTTYTAGEGHMCERPDRTTHSSSSSSYDAGGYTPDVYVPAYTPPVSTPQSSESQYSSSGSSDQSYIEREGAKFSPIAKAVAKQKKRKALRKKIIWFCVIGGGIAFWLLRRKRK